MRVVSHAITNPAFEPKSFRLYFNLATMNEFSEDDVGSVKMSVA